MLVRSHRLRSFLLYVTRSALLHHANHVTEQQIGVHVFGRATDYNASEDNIVRAHARLLRAKLAEYYQSAPGLDEPVVLVIPKGTYLPQFHARTEARPVPSLARRRWIAPLIGALLVCLLVGAWIYVRGAAPRTNAGPAAHVWATLLEGGRPATVVASDYVYMTMQEAAGQTISLDEYLSKNYYRHVEQLNAASGLNRLIPSIAHRHYTGFENVTAIKRLAGIVPNPQRSLSVRYARDLSMRDIEAGNLILIGNTLSNPWVYLFEPRMNFRFVYQPDAHVSVVENREPRAGEERVYRSDPEGATSRMIYGEVAFLPGLQRGNNVLILQGTAMASVEAAISVLENPALYQELANCLGKTKSPYFEALIRTRSVSTVSGETTVAACRVVEQ